MAIQQYPQLNELDWQDKARHLVRFCRTALVGIATTIDYKVTLWGLEEHTPEYRAGQALVSSSLINESS